MTVAKGISNEGIQAFLSDSRVPFDGVFSSDLIPNSIWEKKSYVFVVNTSPSILSWGHFVTVMKTGQTCFFIDPLAMNLYESFTKFDPQCRLVTLSKPIQSTTSHSCGYYAILFILYHFHQPPFKLQFYNGYDNDKLLKNDELCLKYIKKSLVFSN